MLAPLDETSAQSSQQEVSEREAKRISDLIDAEIENERRKLRYDNSVKVLLLGQSESGKSTTLKQFQLIFAANQFRRERSLWRLVIHLNLVRSVRIILEQLNALTTTKPIPFEDNKPMRAIHPLSSLRNSNGSTSSLAVSSQSSGMSSDSDLPSTAESATYSRFSQRMSASPITHSPTTQQPSPLFSSPLPPLLPTPIEMPKLSDYHRTLRMRLLPLLHVEAALLRRLDPSGENFEATQLGSSWLSSSKELFVRSSSNWKEKISRLAHRSSQTETGRSSAADDIQLESPIEMETPDDPSYIIQACKDDMIALWHDPVVRQVLRIGNVRLEEMPGFFLDDIERITSPRYIPSDDDVLRARLKTIGVSEYTYQVSLFGEKSKWTFYDVGGTRTQRPVWQPYFSHVDALIFLAPISAFDQALVEDPRINRLEDSLSLFKSICKSPLLQDVNIVLFLNKTDILKSKLESGIMVSKYVRSYGNRPNEYAAVSKFFRGKFAAVFREYTPKHFRKTFYVHMTNVTETKDMRGILSSVCDSIFRANLNSAQLA